MSERKGGGVHIRNCERQVVILIPDRRPTAVEAQNPDRDLVKERECNFHPTV
jgi:hypothetical protein